jgi:gliding motility-associated-like protein
MKISVMLLNNNITMLKYILSFSVIIFLGTTSLAQPDCSGADYGCTIGNFTTNTSGPGNVVDLPNGNNISNPSTNPGSAGNSGCLFSNELNPTWIIFTVSSPGFLEFTLGQAGGNGFYDWALWPYYEAGSPESINGGDACSEIQNNLLPPVACNWNASGAGFTGMVEAGNLPAGANAGNFENSFLVQPGEQYILCFSNFSGLVGQNVPIYTGSDIPGSNGTNPADITCDPSSLGTTICVGDTATITINTGGIAGATFNFLTNQGDLVDPNATGPDFDVTPIDTTTYLVEVTNGTLTDTVEVTINVVPPPNPDAGLDFVVCSGAVGTLNGSLSDANNTAAWTFTGPIGGVINFTPDMTAVDADITANNDGIYTLTLTESNGVCPDETDDVLVTFENPTIALQSIEPDCYGGSNGEIHVDSPLATSYSFDNGVTWQVDSFATGITADTYTVCIESANGCQTCDDVTVDEGVQVQITTSNDTTICENGTAYLAAQASGGASFDYLWGHTADIVGNVDVEPTAQTTYTVQAENENGCLSLSEDIIIDVNPPLDGSSSPSQTICPGYDTQVSAQASQGNGGPYSYEWTDANGNLVANTSAFDASPSVTTTYTLVITDDCESTPLTLTSEVVVATVPTIDFSAEDESICVPAEFSLTNNTDPALTENSYWFISDGQAFINATPLDFTIDQSGMFDVKLVVETPDGCIDSLNRIDYLTVYPKPKANFNFYPSPVTMLNTEVQFQNYSTGADTYLWNFEGGDPGFSSLEDPVSTFPEGVVDNYNVELIANSIFDCKDTARAIVQVESEVIIYAPNTFTPDGDEFNENWRVFIEGINVQDFDLEIFNRWGQLIWESHDPSASWDGTYGGQNGEKVPEGTYVWKIRTRDFINDNKYEWQGHVTIIY